MTIDSINSNNMCVVIRFHFRFVVRRQEFFVCACEQKKSMITTNRNNERKKKRSIFLMLQLLEISARDDQGLIVQILITWNFCFCLRIFFPTACISRIESKYLFLRAKVLLYGYGVA